LIYRKYEGQDAEELRDVVVLTREDPTHPTFKTNPHCKPLMKPLTDEELLKQTYQEIFQRNKDGRKKQHNYVNFSMEKYNLITHTDLVKQKGTPAAKTTGNNNSQTAHTEYHQQFFNKRVNYDHLKLTLSDTRMAKPHLLQNFNPIAASQMQDPEMRQEV